MPLSPTAFLLMLLSLLAACLTITWLAKYLRASAFCAKSRELGLQFSHPDRFLLGARVARMLPVPGAAEVTVSDVAYAKIDQGLLCVMTASFTIGTVGHRRMIRRVCAALDPGGGTLKHFNMLEGKPTTELYSIALNHLKAGMSKT